MWFKNVCLYHLPAEWTLTAGALEALLAQHRLQPCSALAMQSLGFIAPGDDERLVLDHDRHALFALGQETKLLPASVVRDEVQTRARIFEQQRGFAPSRKALRDMKDQITDELLPRAFVKRGATRAWVDAQAQRLVVDATSANRAETVVEQLRDAMEQLEALPVQTDPSPSVTLTGWLQAGRAPSPFTLAEECELTAPDEGKAVVRYLRHPLESHQLRTHLDQGFHVTRLALVWREQVSFVVNDKLELKRISFLEMDEDPATQGDDDTQDANFALMTGLLSGLIDDLLQVLGATSGAR